MSNRSKTLVRVLAALGILIVVIAATELGFLIYPGHPGMARSMRFDGFVMLPRHGILNVLDYLTIDGRTLFVTGSSSGSVFEVALGDDGTPRGTVREWKGAPRAHGVALASRDLAFVTRSEVNAVDAFSPASLSLVTRIAVPEDPDAILYDRAANLIYVSNGDAEAGTLIDPQTRKLAGTIALGGKPEFAALDPETGLVYQNLQSTNSLVAIDPAKRAIVKRWSLDPCEAPTGIAIDSRLRRIFAVCSKNALLVVFDAGQGRVVASLKIGGGPDAVAFDPSLHRIYATGLMGELSVVCQEGADSYRLLDLIPTHFAAHTLAVDPVSHKIYVGYASLFVAPRLAVFTALK